MRRSFLFILTILVLLLNSGCQKANRDIQQPVNFYYRANPVDYNSSSGVITAETRESSGYEQDPIGLIEQYLQGPLDAGYLSPFPSDVHVEELNSGESALQITLSANFSDLSGHNLTIACACLSKTLMEIMQCDTVQIYASGCDLGGNRFIEMKSDSFLFLDEYIQ